MEDKYINWFRHVQKCHYNPRCKFRTLYEYACLEILGKYRWKLYYREPDKDHYDTPNIFSYSKEHFDIEVVEKLFAYNFPKFTLHDDEEMTVSFEKHKDCNLVSCLFSNARCEFKFPRSLFYQETLDSDVEICNPDETRKMAKQLCALKSVFDIEIIVSAPKIVNSMLNSINQTHSEKLQRIADYGQNYLKRWNRFIVKSMDDSLVMYNPTKRIMLEINEDISKAELTDNWKVLQEVIKRPYFQFVSSIQGMQKQTQRGMTLRISKADMGDYNNWRINAPWYDIREKIESVIIENGVTRIGSRAFYGCKNLQSIEIPDSVTSIGHSAFSCCSSLKSIEIPDGIKVIDKWMFEKCHDLQSISIPASIKCIENNAFYECNNINSIRITDLAAWCRIYFEDNPITPVSHLYLNGEEITDLNIPEAVTAIEAKAFTSLASLTSVNIHDSVTYIGKSAFEGCTGLTSIELQNGIRIIGKSAFKGCTSLTTVVLPESVIYVDNDAFRDCTSLKKVIAKKYVKYFVKDIIFRGCSNLETIEMPEPDANYQPSKKYEVLQIMLRSNNPKSLERLAYAILNSRNSTTPYRAKDILASLDIDTPIDEEAWWFRPGYVRRSSEGYSMYIMEISEHGFDTRYLDAIAQRYGFGVGRSLQGDTYDPEIYIITY